MAKPKQYQVAELQTDLGTIYAQANAAYSQANAASSSSNTANLLAGGTISGDLTVTGNLVISGNTTTLNTETIVIEDNEIVLNSNVAGAPTLNSGIIVNRGSSTNTFLRWNESTDKWGWSDDGSAFVPFANAVLKTGDTMTGNLTMTGTQPAIRLEESGSGGSKRLQLSVNSAGVAIISADQSAQELAFTTVGSERMRITSGGDVGIGTSSPSAKLDIGSGNLAFSSTAQRITGDFSNATHVNRLSFQSSVTNGATSPFFIPNGTGTSASVVVANASDPTNCSFGQFIANGSTDVRVTSGILGTGSYLPMTFYTGGSERARIDTSGDVGIGTTAPLNTSTNRVYLSLKGKGTTAGDGIGVLQFQTNAAGSTSPNIGNIEWHLPDNSSSSSTRVSFITSSGEGSTANNRGSLMAFATKSDGVSGAGTERMRIDSSGNLGIGTSSPGSLLSVGSGATAIYGGGTSNESVVHINGAGPSNDAVRGQITLSDTKAYNASPLFIASFAGKYNSSSSYTFFSGIGGGKENATDGNYAGYLAFYSRPHGGTNTERARIDSSGNLGVGTSSPIFLTDILSGTPNTGANVNNPSQLSITGPNKTLTGGGATVFVNSNSDMAIDRGGSIALSGRSTNSSTTSVVWGVIKGAKENSTSTNAAGYLAFATQNHSVGALVEQARFNSTGAFVFAGGTTTADGIGITFPATQSASSNANTLDDYEEGSFTPVIRGSGTAGTYELSTATGTYTKIGRLVTVTTTIVFAGSITGGGTGYMQVTGFPFTNASTAIGAVAMGGLDMTANYTWLIAAPIGTSGVTTWFLSECGDNVVGNDFPISGVSASDRFSFTASYQI